MLHNYIYLLIFYMEKQYHNYFEDLKKIPLNQRSAYLRTILEVKQTQQEFIFPNVTYPKSENIEARGILHNIYIWQPPQNSNGLIMFMHGLGGHSGTSAYIAKQIVEKNNMTVIGYDFRNFGKSGGDQRGYVDNINTLIQDAEAVIEILNKRFEPKKLFLAGLSMGGAVAFQLCLRNKYSFSGVIFFAPGLRENYESFPFAKKLVKFIGRLCPLFKLTTGKGNSSVKHESLCNIVDPLNYTGRQIPGSLNAILTYMQTAEQKFEKFTTPYLLLMGGTDKIVDPFLSVDLHEKSKTKDKTTIVIKSMWHVIWKQDEIFFLKNDITKWLSVRI